MNNFYQELSLLASRLGIRNRIIVLVRIKIIDMMRKIKKNSTIHLQAKGSTDAPQPDELFYHITHQYGGLQFEMEEQNKVIHSIKGEISRPETSYTLRKDYRNLIDLVQCGGKMKHCRYKSMAALKKIKRIHDSTVSSNFYKPVKKEIRTSESHKEKKKFQTCSLTTFKNYLHKNQKNSIMTFEDVFSSIIQLNLPVLKDIIPVQSKFLEKINIFGKMTEEEKGIIVEEARKFIQKQKQTLPINKFTLKYQVYLVNYFIMKKMMIKICQNPHFLENKRQNIGIYEEIKKQMVGELIDEGRLGEIVELIDQYDRNKFKMSSFCENPIHQAEEKVKLKEKPKTAPLARRRKLHQNKKLTQTSSIQSPQIQRTWKEKQIIRQFDNYFSNALSKLQTRPEKDHSSKILIFG